MINKKKNIIIKPYEIEDVPILERWLYSGDYPEYFRDTGDLTREQLKVFSWMKDGQAYIVWKDYGFGAQEALGLVMLHELKPVALTVKFGILIDKKYQNTGLCNDVIIPVMDYVFYKMNYRKFIIEVVESNTILNKLAQDRGFKREAVLELETKVNREYKNVVRWAAFKDDYEEKVKDLREKL